jgi:hypothetical protein
VLVRPHPERLKEWAGIDLSHYDNVAFRGRNPIDPDSKHDYFDALYHSSAVIGLVTSAFLEAAIVGRPVLTMTLPEYRTHQEEMVHFQYLTQVAGGLLRVAPDMETHLGHLREAVSHSWPPASAGPPEHESREEANTRFLTAFVRPQGLDVPATPAFVDAVERLHQSGTSPDRSLDRTSWLRPFVALAVRTADTRPGRWLMRDPREDEWERHRSWEQGVLEQKVAARTGRQRDKQQRRARRQRRDAWLRRGKEAKSALMTARYYAAVAYHRALALAGFKRDR